MLIGICQVPFAPHGWLAPLPTVRSYNALRQIGVSGLRLQFDPTIASPKAGTWDTSLFRQWVNPAHEAGMRINLNYQGGPIANWPSHQDAAFVRSSMRQLVAEFGDQIESWSFGNEPGADAQEYEGDDGPTAERDYMRDVYMPMCNAFVRGALTAAQTHVHVPGCDADSADIQRRYMALIGDNCDEEAIHPYGEVGNLAYATLEAFGAVRSHRPWGIREIDHQQLPSAIQRQKDVTTQLRADGATESEAALQGALARLRPTPDETMTLVELLRRVGREFRDCARLMLGCPDYFFERGKAWNGTEVCSFYLDQPAVSDGGRAFAAAIAEINGPVDPVRTTTPVRRRTVR